MKRNHLKNTLRVSLLIELYFSLFCFPLDTKVEVKMVGGSKRQNESSNFSTRHHECEASKKIDYEEIEKEENAQE